MHSDGLVYLDGRMLPRHAATLDTDAAGFVRGDGLFETLRVDAGRAVDVAAHLDRLFSGMVALAVRIPEDRAELGRVVGEVANAAPRPHARLRITVSVRPSRARPTRVVEASDYVPPTADAYARGVAARIERHLRVHRNDALRRIKSISWQRRALPLRGGGAGVWEALVINEEGRVVEGSRSNVVVRAAGCLLTPPVDDGCLPGTVRRRLLEAGLVSEASLTVDEVLAAEELLLTNSLAGVVPVGRLDTTDVAVGTTAAELAVALRAGAGPTDR